MPTQRSQEDVTELLRAWYAGDRGALERLVPLVHAELLRLGRAHVRRAHRPGSGDDTLQATALVHEAYLALVDQRRTDWQDRKHFFGVAALVMRRVLLRRAEKKSARKRGGDVATVPLVDDPVDVRAAPNAGDMLSLERALEALGRADPRKARIVTLRFLAGCSVAETAAEMSLSPATVKREWRTARAWLRQALEAPQAAAPEAVA